MSAERRLLDFLFKTETGEQNEQTSPTPHKERLKESMIPDKQMRNEESRDDSIRRKCMELTKNRSIPKCFEQDIIDWVHTHKKPIYGKTIQRYALQLVNPIMPSFKASNWWLETLKKRYSLKLKKVTHRIAKKRKTTRTKQVISPTIEEIMVDWVRMQSKPISATAMRMYALELYSPIVPHFRASNHWLRRFLDRHSLHRYRK